MTDTTQPQPAEAPPARLSAEQEAAIRRILDGQGSMDDVTSLMPYGLARRLLAEIDALRAQMLASEGVLTDWPAEAVHERELREQAEARIRELDSQLEAALKARD